VPASRGACADCLLIQASGVRCDHIDDNNNNVVMMDRHVPPTIGCGSMVGKQAPAGANETDPKYFPRYWYEPCKSSNYGEDQLLY
jgi:hypothetical protein